MFEIGYSKERLPNLQENNKDYYYYYNIPDFQEDFYFAHSSTRNRIC